MTTYHILNGDALVNRFTATGLEGKLVIMRECLIEGDMTGETLDSFYHTRANYLAATYKDHTQSYYTKVVSEFEKLNDAPNLSTFNLWFGYDLFCSTNMWFILFLLQKLLIDKKIFIIYPSHLTGSDVWLDFGTSTPEQLLSCYHKRVLLEPKHIQLASELWQAYKLNDLSRLEQLSRQPSACYPYLEEVCQAHIDRFAGESGKGRPERVIEELLTGPIPDFNDLFNAFSKREGIYGFSNLQVKRMYEKIMQNY